MNYADCSTLLLKHLPPLFPTQAHNAALSRAILEADLFAGKSGPFVEATRAGLLLFNDDLNTAHQIVQAAESPINNFWHAILHRREADFSNARYWWGRVKNHEAMEEIYDLVIHRIPDYPFLDELRQTQRWEPVTFSDFCQAARTTGQWEAELRHTQRLEMKTLLEWCASRCR